MAIDNQFRIGELISSGSRAIVSKDEVSGNHTFTLGSKEVIDTPYEHIKGERDGELTGRIEKPKYNEEELKKSVDTVVDELISAPRPVKPDVVPRPVYDALNKKFLDVSKQLSDEKIITRELRANIATLESQVQSLLVQVDALSLQTAAAQNEAQATNDRYTTLLQDFSSAIVKSTKEGIERVSLKAQTEGLIAQKESLRMQLQGLQSQLAGAAAESSAAAAGLTPGQDNEFFYGVTQEGSIDPAWSAQDIGWTTSRKNSKTDGKAGSLDIKNLRDDNVNITKLEITSVVGRGTGNKRILGFTNGNSPSLSKSVNIEQGAQEKVDIYFNIGLASLDRNTYSGSWKVKVTYSDGTSSETGTISWGLRVNNG